MFDVTTRIPVVGMSPRVEGAASGGGSSVLTTGGGEGSGCALGSRSGRLMNQTRPPATISTTRARTLYFPALELDFS